MNWAASSLDSEMFLSLHLWSVHAGESLEEVDWLNQIITTMTQSACRASRYHKVPSKPDPTRERINLSLLGRESRVDL